MTETASFFADGQAYERLMGRWSRAAGELFLDWLSLPKGLKWLDVGCGTGAFTELVIPRTSPPSNRLRIRLPTPITAPWRCARHSA